MNEFCKVVIVDDELLIRQGIKHYIQWEQEGFQIVGEASNGQEALQVIASVRPHIVITDIVMPVMDGEELTKVIRNQYPDIEVIVLSSFGEFDYVRSTFQHGVTDYILKPKLDGEILLKTLHNAAEKIPSLSLKKRPNDEVFSIQTVLDKWMSGYEVKGEENVIKQTFPHSHYLMIGVDLKKRDSSWSALEKSIRGKIEQYVPESVVYSLHTEDECISFLVNVNKAQIQLAFTCIEQLASSHDQFIWAVSAPFSALKEVKQVYDNSLLTLMNYSFYFPEQTLFSHEMMPPLPTKPNQFNLTVFTELFKSKQYDKAVTYLHSHVKELSTDYSMNVLEFKRFISNVLFNITLLLNNMGYESSNLTNKKFAYFAAIDSAANVTEAVDQLNHFLSEATNIVVQTTNTDPNVKRILDYIEENYAEPLTLTELADHFHFNPSYLSTYFSTHIHEGFTEYVTKVRIEKSIELLRNRNVSISEISGKVGYSDHSYFCKVFKKLKGMSPSNYRKQFVT